MQVSELLMASRPLAWFIAPAIWFSGLIHSSSGTPSITPQGLLFALALSFPTCLVTFGVNDAYDYPSDQHNVRKKSTWTDGVPLPTEHHKTILRICKCLTLLIVLMTYPAWRTCPRLLLYVSAYLVLVWMYSAPLALPWSESRLSRLKERPVLDSLSNGAICWLFWACGYIFTGETPRNAEFRSSYGWLVFLFGSACHSLAAMADIHEDQVAGYRTIAVWGGDRGAAAFAAVCFALAKFTVVLWSDVGIAISAGIVTSAVLVAAPQTKHVLVRLVFLGSYAGSIVWALKKIVGIAMGQDVTQSW
ncbi:hypothetical protein K491DRAFT_665596 [Lophiostoma macrostomum CBS 122681]|uniref:UbiA prenyltransferase n=1 Tax=Lophiostoma macrostomum CBS 122681 TaxID=1314788 RepID=A0A6A6SUI7_9PLEO|nr:hypothetical protein K491DRAFT_665596 [Lophiostoma macrostomum CBS 122681]